MKGIIIAGGYATRLKPLTENQPKHLLPIGGKLMMDRLMEDLNKLAVDHYYLVTNDKFAHNFEEWLETSQWKDKITVVNDGTTCNEDRLGSIGDMKFPVDKFGLDDDLFIIAADNLTDFDFNQMIERFKKTGSPVVGAYDVGDFDIVRQCSEITTDEEGRILTFTEKPENPTHTDIATCYYLVPKTHTHCLAECIADGRHDKAGELVAEMLKHGDVHAISHDGYWFDVGSYDSYQAANEFIKHREK